MATHTNASSDTWEHLPGTEGSASWTDRWTEGPGWDTRGKRALGRDSSESAGTDAGGGSQAHHSHQRDTQHTVVT